MYDVIAKALSATIMYGTDKHPWGSASGSGRGNFLLSKASYKEQLLNTPPSESLPLQPTST
jgi:hypothetical protein